MTDDRSTLLQRPPRPARGAAPAAEGAPPFHMAGIGLAGVLTLVLLALLALLGSPATAKAQGGGVAYSLVPTYEELRWDDLWGFERTRLPGARVGLDFGPLVSLQPFYTRATDVAPRDGIADDRRWRIEAFGADMQFQLLPGNLSPFVRAGGGVLRLDDGENDRDDRILLRAGGGLRFGVGTRLAGEVWAENWANRLEAPYLSGAGSADDLPNDGFVRSVVFGAGLRVPVGGDASGWRAGGGAFLPGLFAEPFAGRLDFDDELGLDRQYLAGVRAGLDVNRNVGVRAYYWRGVDRDFSETEPIEGYGGEAQFNLGTGPGLVPFLVAGGGRIDFRDGFGNGNGNGNGDGETRLPENHLILGGGVSVALADRARIEVGARNLLFSASRDLEDVTSPDELRSNWMYTAGLSLSFGADPEARARREREREIARAETRERERTEATERERAELQAEIRALRAAADTIRAPRPVEPAVAGTTTLVDPTTGQRLLLVPVPEVGEIILRFGDAYATESRIRPEAAPAGVTPADLARLERMVVEAVRGDVAPGDTLVTRLRIAELEARIPEIVRSIVREELERIERARPEAPRPEVRPEREVAPPAPVTAVPGTDRTLGRVEPLVGIQATAPTQVLAGVRLDLGRITPSVPLDLVPELTFGIGEGDPSLFLGLHARYTFRGLDSNRNFHPYLLGGAALTSRNFLRLNLGYGLEFDVRGEEPGARPYRLFVEHLGVGLFSEQRFLVGVGLALGGDR